MTESEHQASDKERDRIDSERKHLEGLLKDRINFHLLFGSAFMLVLSRIEASEVDVRAVVLGATTILSSFITMAILRTHLLVGKALKEIIEKYPTHPYTRYREQVSFPWNANKILIMVPFFLTGFFAIGTIYYVYLYVSGQS